MNHTTSLRWYRSLEISLSCWLIINAHSLLFSRTECIMASLPPPSQGMPQSTDVTVERVDTPRQKLRVKRQVERLRRLSISATPCLLINIIYFTYRVKCCLDSFLQLSLLDNLIVWMFFSLELTLACKLYEMISAGSHNFDA